MQTVGRAVVAFVSLIATFFFVFWIGGALLLGLGLSPQLQMLLSYVVASLAAFTVGWFVWTHTQAGLISSIFIGAFTLGSIGFCLGFFGPLIFAPGANQGPLLGIFITGPLGFVLGAIGGGAHWALNGRNAD
jgi:hypothetical protein